MIAPMLEAILMMVAIIEPMRWLGGIYVTFADEVM